MQEEVKIAVIGTGYVGLPLAVEFSKKFKTIAFDINTERIKELKGFQDTTSQLTTEELKGASSLSFTDEATDMKDFNYYIVAVPTPINDNKKPDLKPLLRATETVGTVLKKSDTVVYESTVYPGLTEEICIPLLEEQSDLKINQDFFVGYSPERVNPSDQTFTLTQIVKITSGSTPQAAKRIDQLYKSIIKAGTYPASCIKVAEAAKVIENTQRDINIAFINELAMFLDKVGIDTNEVLDAACTKWNFLNFRPGLVGGHCIAIDPYYLAYKAQKLGHHFETVLVGRKINDDMGLHIVNHLIKLLIKKGEKIKGCRILILGITFKENCPDTRNSRVIDIIKALEDFDCIIDVYDPLVSKEEIKQICGFEPVSENEIYEETYNAAILAVAHKCFEDISFSAIKAKSTILYDIKGILEPDITDYRL